ncbi:MAG TPA: alpha/beta hydrolase [Solirubrobacteraceae bacterium]|nr:alpha/beta hydrolase [Solirubrobacteraceae bacterium]
MRGIVVKVPSVVFFPGATGAGDFWSPVADRLPPHWQTELISWPGAGAVPALPGVDGYADLVALAAELVPDGSDVVAQSMGGVVAIGLALARPRKIRRLVLVATSGGVDVSGLGGSQWRDEYRAEFPRAGAWVTGDAPDHSAQLSSLELPVCLIWGDADPISPVAVGDALLRLLPSSELHVIAGGTHALASEQPDRVAALVQRHLDGAATRG